MGVHEFNPQGIVVDGKIDRRNFVNKVSNIMIQEFKIKCLIRITTPRNNMNITKAHTSYGYCKYSKNKSWKLSFTRFTEATCTLTVKANFSKPCDHSNVEDPIFYHLRGSDRVEQQEKMRNIQPKTHFRQETRLAKDELTEDGNMQNMRPLGVYQKASSQDNFRFNQELMSGDLKCILAAVNEEENKTDKYIRGYIYPVTVYLFSQMQLQFVNNVDFLYFDSTGSIIRPPHNVTCKRMQLYSMVFVKGEVTLPIAEMITSEHTVFSVTSFLKNYVEFLRTEKWKLPIAKVIVTDWCWALMHSILDVFINTDIKSYLQKCYKIATGEIKENINFMLIYTCCFHNIRRMKDSLKEICNDDEIIKFTMNCLKLMMLSTNLTEVEEVFDIMMTALLTTEKNLANVSYDCMRTRLKGKETRFLDDQNSAYKIDEAELDESSIKQLCTKNQGFTNILAENWMKFVKKLV